MTTPPTAQPAAESPAEPTPTPEPTKPVAVPSPTAETGPRWERRLRTVCMTIARLGLGYLFFTQLFWKLPPTFNCQPDFAFTSAKADGSLQRTGGGLCDWIGIESVWAQRPRRLFQVVGGPGWGIDVSPLVKANGAFIDNVVKPNIRWMGWLIWGGEAFIALSMILGLFTRLGGLVAAAISAQLMIGLAGIRDPYEWEWSYNLMFFLSVAMLGIAPGRYFGLDTLIRPRLQALALRGKRIARFLLPLT